MAETILKVYEIQNIGKGVITNIQPDNLLTLVDSNNSLWKYDNGGITTVNGNNSATGSNSLSHGQYSVASGNYGAFASGYQAIASGDTSYAQGDRTTASGNYSRATGSQTTASGYLSFVHGKNSQANGNTTIVLGSDIIGNDDDKTYVDFLNIKSIPTGTPVNNLGYDANGNVIIGTAGGGGGGDFWSAGTGTNAIGVINHGGTASGNYAVTMGWQTVASGPMSLAQNSGSTASGYASYAEGAFTIASGQTSHAQGFMSIAGGSSSHAEGAQTRAIGHFSHAGGVTSEAIGNYSFVHGYGSYANGESTIVLGQNITGNQNNTTYVEGLNIGIVGGSPSVNNLGIDANGFVVIGSTGGGTDIRVTGGTYSAGVATFRNNTGGTFTVSGFSTNGNVFWASGSGENSLVTVNGVNTATGLNSIAMGNNSVASGSSAHAEGSNTRAYGDYSHAEGGGSIASGQGSHAEGGSTLASGLYGHAEGFNTQATGGLSHSEGQDTVASGAHSHAEGFGSQAIGNYSHAQGRYSRAIGNCSHAGGGRQFVGSSGGTAIGDGSFVHGENSYVGGTNSIVLGANITGNTADTTYVDNFNIKTVGAGPGTIDIGIDATGKVVNQASDERLKENINTIENALDTVNSLRGVTYNWKDRTAGSDALRYGFIAQEVQQVVPDLITQNGEYLGVQYKDVPALLVEAIKQLTDKVNELEQTIIELKK